MGIDIGGNTITQASGVLTLDTGVDTYVTSAGAVRRPNNALFSANGPATWIYIPVSTWLKMALPNVLLNGNGAYDGALTRFTAPVSGRYTFQLIIYMLKDGAAVGEYFHPSFAVNGAIGGRTVNTAYPDYRVRGHGWAVNSYHYGNLSESYDLIAGDYVEPYIHGSAVATNRYYQGNSRFTGCLLG